MLVKQTFTTRRMIDLFNHRSLWWPLEKWLCTETKIPRQLPTLHTWKQHCRPTNPEMAELRETEQQPASLDQDSIPKDMLEFLNLDSDQGGDKEDYRLPFCEETFYSDSD